MDVKYQSRLATKWLPPCASGHAWRLARAAWGPRQSRRGYTKRRAWRNPQALGFPADRGVGEACANHFMRLRDVAQVDDDRRPQRRLQPVKVQSAELVPLG